MKKVISFGVIIINCAFLLLASAGAAAGSGLSNQLSAKSPALEALLNAAPASSQISVIVTLKDQLTPPVWVVETGPNARKI